MVISVLQSRETKVQGDPTIVSQVSQWNQWCSWDLRWSLYIPTRQGIKGLEKRESIPVDYIKERRSLVLATRKSLISFVRTLSMGRWRPKSRLWCYPLRSSMATFLTSDSPSVFIQVGGFQNETLRPYLACKIYTKGPCLRKREGAL